MGPVTRIGDMRCRAFTLIELLVVLFLVAILASLVAPVVTGSIGRAKESALREDLYLMRKGIDDYHADHGTYPVEIEQLVEKRYLRKIPVDPITGKRDTWIFVREGGALGNKNNTIVDVHSGSEDRAIDGSAYKEW